METDFLRLFGSSCLMWTVAAAGPVTSDTFDAAALIAHIAKLHVPVSGASVAVVIPDDVYSVDLRLRATVSFDAGTAELPMKLNYWVFEDADLMTAATQDWLFLAFNMGPDGEDVLPWQSYTYAGSAEGATERSFLCSNAWAHTTSDIVNASCIFVSDNRQTVVGVDFEDQFILEYDSILDIYAAMLAELNPAVTALFDLEKRLGQAGRQQRAVQSFVDPILVGNWETHVSFGASWTMLRLEISGEGRYLLYQDRVKQHSGVFVTQDGGWAMTSQTNGWRDFGRYEMPDVNTFNMNSQLGPSTWRRVGS